MKCYELPQTYSRSGSRFLAWSIQAPNSAHAVQIQAGILGKNSNQGDHKINYNNKGKNIDKRLLGKSKDGNLSLLAAKDLTRREFYYLGNIAPCVSENGKSYLLSIGVTDMHMI